MTDSISDAGQQVGWGWVATDDQIETVREYVEEAAGGGSSDWLVAVSVYELGEDLNAGGVSVPAGTYVRTVEDNLVRMWQVDTPDAAIAYANAVEAAYLASREACTECGAAAGEDCLVPGCQGDWT